MIFVKKLFIIGLSVSMYFCTLSLSSAASLPGSPNIFVNNQQKSLSIPPKVVDNRVLLSVKSVSELLNKKLNWNNSLKTLETEKSGTPVSLQQKGSVTYLNNRPVASDLQIRNINGWVYIPVRLVPELFDAAITWQQTTHSLYITTDTNVHSETELSSEDSHKLIVLGLPEGISLEKYAITRSGVPNDSHQQQRMDLEGIGLTIVIKNNSSAAVNSSEISYSVTKSLGHTPKVTGNLALNEQNIIIPPGETASFLISATAYANEQIQLTLSKN